MGKKRRIHELLPGEMVLEERKRYLIKILDAIHLFCTANNIKYCLHSGTLLGAIRHDGFIPWDDDIDICMPRPDYERFIKIYHSNDYTLYHYTNLKKLATPFIKISDNSTYSTTSIGTLLPYGLSIDIFPIDGYPEDEKERKKWFKKQDFLFHYGYLLIKTFECKSRFFCARNVLSFFIKFFLRFTVGVFVKTPYICKVIDDRAKANDFSDSSIAGCSVALYSRKIEIARKASYEELVLKTFEGKEYYIPKDFDDVLTSIYGKDYMTPPPEDKRIPEHEERIFLRVKE